jgi:hypothetical protein
VDSMIPSGGGSVSSWMISRRSGTVCSTFSVTMTLRRRTRSVGWRGPCSIVAVSSERIIVPSSVPPKSRLTCVP